MNEKKLYDFVIVGAGPVGLALALGLCRAGKSVLVLEKKPELSPHSRAPAIWPRTQEIFRDLGVIDEFLDQGILVPQIELRDADQPSEPVLLRLDLKDVSDLTDFPQLLIFPQQKTEALLLNALKTQYSTKAKILFSAEMLDFKQNDQYVEIYYHSQGEAKISRASFLVGCDGAHSRVRELLGFKLKGQTYPIQASLADVRLKDKKTYAFPRFSTKEQLAVGILLEQDLWRIILPYPETDKLEIDERIRKATSSLFGQSEYEVIWKSDFKIHRRLSSGFAKGRVVIAGDAAHLNSPVGGQGMNAGIQDTLLLIEKLLEALEQDSPDPLKEYDQIRRQEIKLGVNRFTNQVTQLLLFQKGRYLKGLFKTANVILRWPPARRNILKKIAMLE